MDTQVDMWQHLDKPKVLRERLDFVIGSTYRSGTTYTSNVLRALGIKCGHESVFQAYDIQWPVVFSDSVRADCSGAAPLWLDMIKQSKLPLIQLIRHPVPTINSMTKYGLPARPFEECCERWYDYHTRMMEFGPVALVHLEHFEYEMRVALEEIGIKICPARMHTACTEAGRGTSTKQFRYRWSDLPTKVTVLADHLGYTTA